jgi:hypothetical protein
MIVARALKNSQLTCGERHAYFGYRILGHEKVDSFGAAEAVFQGPRAICETD